MGWSIREREDFAMEQDGHNLNVSSSSSGAQNRRANKLRTVCDPSPPSEMNGVRERFEAIIGPHSEQQDRINTQAAFLIVMLLNMDISTQEKDTASIETLLARLKLESQIHNQAIASIGRRRNVDTKANVVLSSSNVYPGCGYSGLDRGRVGDTSDPRLKGSLH